MHYEEDSLRFFTAFYLRSAHIDSTLKKVGIEIDIHYLIATLYDTKGHD